MRAATLILLLLAAVASWCAYRWVVAGANLAVPPEVGKPLVRFKLEEVSEIQLRRGGENAIINPIRKVWYLTNPTTDRLDPNAALALFFGLNGLELCRVLPEDQWKDHPLEFYGLGHEAVRVRLLDKQKKTLHDFRLGHLTPWKKGDNSTMYVQWKNGPNPDDILVVAGNLRVLLDRPFDMLRARQALYLPNPPVRVLVMQGESRLEMARQDPSAPWRLLRPIEDRADPAAIEAFLRALSETEATSLTPWEETPFPEQDSIRLAVAMQPADADEAARALEEYSHVSAREQINYRPSPGLLQASFRRTTGRNGNPELVVRFNDRPHDLHIPTKVLDVLTASPARFRARNLCDLDPNKLNGIEIQVPGSISEAVQLESREDGWFVGERGTWTRADAPRLRALLDGFNAVPVLSFPNDGLTQAKGFGLESPVLVAAFAGKDHRVRKLRLGRLEGKTYGWFEDTPSVYELPEAVLATLPASPAAWRSRAFFDFAAADIRQIVLSRPQHPEVALRYNVEENSWTALAGDADRTADLDRIAAANLTAALERLHADRWLAEGTGPAQAALSRPSLTIRFTVVPMATEGGPAEPRRFKLDFAPTAEQSTSYFGRLNDEPDVFLVKDKTVESLAAELFPGAP